MIVLTSVLCAVLALVVLVAIWAVAMYNGLVVLRNRYKNAYSQIDVQLKRRYDLIPNLVETAKGYLKHERETLEAVTLARNQAAGAAAVCALRQGTKNTREVDAESVRAYLSSQGAIVPGIRNSQT